MAERDYVLGTHEEEVWRLGVQHRVWRPYVLDCWYQAGITAGSRVMDVGTGPGYATVDLAEIVGSSGQVIGIERSERFIERAKEACALRQLHNVAFHELDLMSDPLPGNDLDATWCRWVASFVSDPGILVAKTGSVLRKGGVAIFHDYSAYDAWRFAPRKPGHDAFVEEVMSSWRESGGEPNTALMLPGMLHDHGFRLRSARPLSFAITPKDFMWQWPATFLRSHLARLVELGRLTPEWVQSVQSEFDNSERDPATLMVTPVVLELIAVKL